MTSKQRLLLVAGLGWLCVALLLIGIASVGAFFRPVPYVKTDIPGDKQGVRKLKVRRRSYYYMAATGGTGVFTLVAAIGLLARKTWARNILVYVWILVLSTCLIYFLHEGYQTLTESLPPYYSLRNRIGIVIERCVRVTFFALGPACLLYLLHLYEAKPDKI
jgi:hypothetical protein